MSNVKPIPDGYRTISASLTCRGAAQAIEFYKKAFGATERMRMDTPNGKVAHAELSIGDCMIFVNDEAPEMGATAPTPGASQGVYLFMYVNDVDAVFNRAVSAGSRVEMPVQDMFWGDRFGKLTDPFGHRWGIATHKEEVSPEECERRGQAMMAQMAKAAGQS